MSKLIFLLIRIHIILKIHYWTHFPLFLLSNLHPPSVWKPSTTWPPQCPQPHKKKNLKFTCIELWNGLLCGATNGGGLDIRWQWVLGLFRWGSWTFLGGGLIGCEEDGFGCRHSVVLAVWCCQWMFRIWVLVWRWQEEDVLPFGVSLFSMEERCYAFFVGWAAWDWGNLWFGWWMWVIHKLWLVLGLVVKGHWWLGFKWIVCFLLCACGCAMVLLHY